MARWWNTSIAALVVTGQALGAAPEREALASKICSAAEQQAKSADLDPNFFARLLWRESLFDPNVVSNKGAQGIAQFMPETAARRGLVDPFEPIGAVKASAAYLADLRAQFGNLGLAAAAYNAGERRIDDWLKDKGGIPDETREYVLFITGKAIDDWKSPSSAFAIPRIGVSGPFGTSCVALALKKYQLASVGMRSAPPAPWGALLAVNFSESIALAQYRRLKLRFPQALANRNPLIARKKNLSRGTKRLVYVMLGEKTKEAAATTCENLSVAGAPCIVRKN